MEKHLIIYTDGCSKGNPGPASIGVIVYQKGDSQPIFVTSDKIGTTTNNQAEYRALIRALEFALKNKANRVEVRSDSELIVNQMNGTYRVKKAELKPLQQEAKRLAGLIDDFSICSIPREQNREADKLANKALDSGK